MMKNECAVVQDLASLYYEKALSAETVSWVNEHLAGCGPCKGFYDEFEKESSEGVYGVSDISGISDNSGVSDISEVSDISGMEKEKKKEVLLASGKIRKYRISQVCLFGGTILFLITLMLTWFGYPGISEIKGTNLLNHPFAVIGLGLLEFSIWFSFTDNTKRKVCGYVGAGLLILSELLVLGLVCGGSTCGIEIGFINFELLNPRIFEWDWPLMHLGFYVSFAVTVAETLAFRWFCNKITG